MKVLCTSDIHLGREFWQLPEEMKYNPAFAWEDFVNFAIEEKVDIVVLAGDIVDSDRDFFESYSLLEKGLKRLVKANLPIVMVSGNHDVEIVKKLKNFEGLTILGKEESWESRIFEIKGKKVRFDGFSFPHSHINYNPLEKYDLKPPSGDEIAIGVLHCDVNGKKEEGYGAVCLMDFQKMPQRAWILGHIHEPKQFDEDPLIFYCGSLLGLDINERGEHGAVLLEIGNSIEKKSVLKAKLRWEILEIDVSSIADELELIQKIDAFVKPLGNVVLRLVLTGRRNFPIKTDFELSSCFLEKVENLTHLDFDLEKLSKGRDVPAILARSLIALKNNQVEELVCSAKNKVDIAKNSYLQEEVLSSEETKSYLLQTGYAILEKLILQKKTNET